MYAIVFILILAKILQPPIVIQSETRNYTFRGGKRGNDIKLSMLQDLYETKNGNSPEYDAIIMLGELPDPIFYTISHRCSLYDYASTVRKKHPYHSLSTAQAELTILNY